MKFISVYNNYMPLSDSLCFQTLFGAEQLRNILGCHIWERKDTKQHHEIV